MNGYDPIEGGALAAREGVNGEQDVFAERRTGVTATARGPLERARETSAAVAARVIEHYRCRRTLFEWMHPLRLAGVPYGDCVQRAGPAEAAALAEAYLEAAGMRVPPMSSFSAPGAALTLLPMHECLALFRLRALLDHSDELHSWIDRPRRERLNEWVGLRGARLLFARRRDLGVDAMTPVSRSPLGSADADSLARLGYRHFERECGWEPNGPLALAQFAMPADAEHASPLAQPSAWGWNPSLWIVSQLPGSFPEGSW